MRRGFLITCIIIALFLQQGRAQFYNTFANSNVSFSVGPNYYFNHSDGFVGVGADLSFGKWILNTTSLRGVFSAHHVDKGIYGKGVILYGHVDAMFDLITSFKGCNISQFRTYLLCGIGVSHSLERDNDFCGVVGIGADWRMNRDWRLFSELSTIVHPSDFDNNSRSSLLPFLKVGILRDINNNPNRVRTSYETNCFSNDWFVQIALGVNSVNYRGAGDFSNRIKNITPIVEFGLGKRLTTIWGVRLCASGLYAEVDEDLFSYYNIRGDLFWDMMGWLAPEAGHTLFDIRPYASTSIVARLDDQSNFLFCTAFGMTFSYRPDKRNEIFLDARYLVTPPRFVRIGKHQNTLDVGLATITIGYCYSFSHISF